MPRGYLAGDLSTQPFSDELTYRLGPGRLRVGLLLDPGVKISAFINWHPNHDSGLLATRRRTTAPSLF